MKFEKIKEYIVERATELNACSSELDNAKSAKDIDELISVVRRNAGWCRENEFLTDEKSIELFGLSLPNLFNSGYRNSGNSNSGNSNSGNSNSGNSNSGNWNSGNRNSGNWNSGNSNSGYRNSGDSNSGNWNSGNSNSGYRNSGDSNSGNWNSGNWNSGDSNSGNWNSGNSNSGDSNSGYRNSGAFCTDNNPTIWLFDKPTNIPVKEWEQGEAVRIMSNLDPTIWVPSGMMTEEEKKEHKSHETTGGYLKTISLKEAWANLWGNLNEEKRAVFTSLPNFDAEKFEEITGIKV